MISIYTFWGLTMLEDIVKWLDAFTFLNMTGLVLREDKSHSMKGKKLKSRDASEY